MPRYAPNKRPVEVKRRYFELIRQGLSGASAAQQVGVSLSCGSLWFIDAGRVSFVETPISPRYRSQDDRIEIADGLACGEPVKQIAARIGKSYQTVYRELARNRKFGGRYQPWFAHSQAYLRRRRVKPRRFAVDAELREIVAGKLVKHWSPAQISRWLRRRYRRRRSWQVCTETIYEAVYRGLVVPVDRQNLRTGRTYRRRRGRGRSRDGALKQSTSMKTIHQRPTAARSRLRTDFPDDPEMWVSHETIYRSLYVQGKGELKRELTRCLRTGRAVRKPRRSGQRQPRIPNMVSISERPAEAADRALPGHWEGDLILGKTADPQSAPWWSGRPASPCCCTYPATTPPSPSATP